MNLKRNDEEDVRVFSSFEELCVYTEETGQYFPDLFQAGTVLKHFLREINRR